MNTEERLKRLFAASSEQTQAIDDILESRNQEKPMATSGPLLMGMTASAKLLGVSRATLWRMIKGGLLQKIEVLPGSFRLRRADLESIAAGWRKIESQ
jgi:predicted DNA-binding transcriptional regulator AlpA